MTDVLGIQRMVLVQPIYYGIDNSLLVQTLREIGPQCRGVVRVADDAGDDELDRYHRAGIRAIRLDHFARASGRPGRHRLYPHDRRPCPAARVISAVLHPWHHRRDLLPFFSDFEDTFVIDHMGYM